MTITSICWIHGAKQFHLTLCIELVPWPWPLPGNLHVSLETYWPIRCHKLYMIISTSVWCWFGPYSPVRPHSSRMPGELRMSMIWPSMESAFKLHPPHDKSCPESCLHIVIIHHQATPSAWQVLPWILSTYRHHMPSSYILSMTGPALNRVYISTSYAIKLHPLYDRSCPESCLHIDIICHQATPSLWQVLPDSCLHRHHPPSSYILSMTGPALNPVYI